MIKYTQGNLLEAPTAALVNTVNEVGVMGKGIALMFREAFPENTRAYEAACKAGDVRVGRMFVVRERDLTGERVIINFPTKRHWRNPSKLQWIRDGLKELGRVIREKGIRSVAVPPLGCGNGGLEWSQVRREIEAALGELDDVEVIVYEPTASYQNAPKREGVKELTPARSLVVDLIRRYAVLGLDCTNLEVQKLAWFLHRSIRKLALPDILKLSYAANKYGPYTDNLRHLLNGLDGSYLHCEKRLSDAGPFDLIWFDKRFMYEESLRMPLLVRWPGHVKPGAVSQGMVLNVDFAPTLLAAAGLKVPGDMQGRSFLPLLAGETPKDWRTAMYYRYYHYPQHHRVQPHYGIRTERYKLIYFNKLDQWELFDLQADPQELKNLYHDPAQAETVKRLKAELYRLKKELKDEDQYAEKVPKSGV